MYEYFACKCVHHVHTCFPWRSEEDLNTPEMIVNGYEWPYCCYELNEERLQVEGLGRQPNHITLDQLFALPIRNAGVKVSQKLRSGQPMATPAWDTYHEREFTHKGPERGSDAVFSIPGVLTGVTLIDFWEFPLY